MSPSSPPQYLLLANTVVPSIASPVTSRETNVGIPVSSATESKLSVMNETFYNHSCLEHIITATKERLWINM